MGVEDVGRGDLGGQALGRLQQLGRPGLVRPLLVRALLVQRHVERPLLVQRRLVHGVLGMSREGGTGRPVPPLVMPAAQAGGARGSPLGPSRSRTDPAASATRARTWVSGEAMSSNERRSASTPRNAATRPPSAIRPAPTRYPMNSGVGLLPSPTSLPNSHG